MSILKRINSMAIIEKATGFGSNATSYGGRFITKNGNANVKRDGVGFFEGISWFHTLLKIPRWKFLFIIISFYTVINFAFAVIYYLIGIEHLVGINATNSFDRFAQAFFFSVQTFTTVGYGHISPEGFLTSLVASIEALTGLLSFAIVTGLFYGRFSKPKAYVKFAEKAIIAPYQNGTALMIRLTPFKNTTLTDAEVRLTLGMVVEENGKEINRFYNLDLELSKVNALTLSWTIVHPITEKSPLYTLNQENYKNDEAEVIVFLKAFDDMFNATVVKRTSYTFQEIIYGAKFLPMFSKDKDDSKTILQIDKLNNLEKVQL